MQKKEYMARVKFFSEIGCKIYVDTELIGEVPANQILAVELQIGSYLVDIKTTTEELLRRYTLNVESGQSQIIQNVNYKEESILHHIKTLQDDPSIIFHNNRCKIEYNGKFGFINSRFEIIINPIYSDAGDFLTDKILVKKFFSDNEKATIIDVNGNICYGKWFDYIEEDANKVLLLHNNKFVVISKADYSIIAEYERIRDYQPKELIPVGKRIGLDDMYGYIDSVGNEIIPFIFNKAYNFDESGFARVERHGIGRVVDKDGNVYICLEDALKDGKEETRIVSRFFVDKIESVDIESVKIESVEEKYIYKAAKLPPEEAKTSDFFGRYYTPIKENNKWALRDDDEFILSDEVALLYVCDRIFYFNEVYFAYRLNNECIIINFSDPKKNKSFKYDTIYPVLRWKHTFQAQYDDWELTSIIVSHKGKYGLIDSNGNELLPIIYDRIETTDATEAVEKFVSGTIGIIWKDDKCSLVNLINGVLFDDIIYDDITFNPWEDVDILIDSIFIVKKDKKYGCRDADFKEILPAIYDRMDFKLDYFDDGYIYKIILSIGTKKGVYEFCKNYNLYNPGPITTYRFSTEVKYDECVFLDNKNSVAADGRLSYVGVRKNNKWGILDATYSWATNEEDLEFKYDSLEALIADANQEFRRRIRRRNEKYYDDGI